MKVEIKAITPNCEKLCEEAGRVCYASESKITEDSHTSFLKNIIKSGHTSVIEHAFVTFKVEGVSRACLDQLARHRLISLSVESQRYVNQEDAEFVIPPTAKDEKYKLLFKNIEDHLKESIFLYKNLINMGLKKEDARFILPQGVSTSFTMTCNFRELLHIIDMRVSLGAQWEIRDLFTEIWKMMLQEAPNVFGLEYFEHWSKDFNYKKGVFELLRGK